jgi:hypothetical protein
MIAPTLERAPRMLLVIGQDEQGLPTETIILEPSMSQLYASVRAWLQGVLPTSLHRALGLTRPSHANPVAARADVDRRPAAMGWLINRQV